LHDTHFHLDLYPDRESVLNEVESKEIYTIAVTNAPSVFSITQNLIRGKKFWRAALGLHPELVESHGKEIMLFESLLKETNYIGEVGLDYKQNTIENRSYQRQIFQRIIELSELNGGKIITIHSRRAENDVVEVLRGTKKCLPILHWFSGSSKSLKAALEAGCWFSINTAMIRSEKGRSLVGQIPYDRVLLESDGPFLEVNRSPVRPVNLHLVIEELSSVWGVDTEETAATIHSNFKELLRRAQP
jgi:TatD DNase family protein